MLVSFAWTLVGPVFTWQVEFLIEDWAKGEIPVGHFGKPYQSPSEDELAYVSPALSVGSGLHTVRSTGCTNVVSRAAVVVHGPSRRTHAPYSMGQGTGVMVMP